MRLLWLFFCGCGGLDPSSSTMNGSTSCQAYMVPAGTDLSQPTVSFKRDVMHIFNASCGSSKCHGTHDMPEGGLFLGEESAMGGDAAEVWAGLVAQPSHELSSMAFVTAHQPDKSYLMHKLDGDQCLFESQCQGGRCFAMMPQDSDQPLPVATRDVVRRWIAQGAADN